MLWDNVMGIIKQMTDKQRMMAWLGLMIGFSTGIFIAGYVMVAGFSILMALVSLDFLNANRGSKLLIKYHDMLKENGLLEEDDKQQDGQIFTEGESNRQPFC